MQRSRVGRTRSTASAAATASAACQMTYRAAAASGLRLTTVLLGNTVAWPTIVAISPRAATVTPAASHCSRSSSTARAEANSRYATTVAQTAPTVRNIGDAPVG